jgi:uncharacterized protein
VKVLLDTGPWVALLSERDRHHNWAKQQFAAIAGPLLSCEAVLSETCFLLHRSGFAPSKAMLMVERGAVQLDFSLPQHLPSVRALFERYDNVPASLADACLIRMSELHEPSKVLTLDGDFRIYRKANRRVIPVIAPWDN